MGSTSEALPKGLNNAFLFATFNALSFQVVLASPMILYGKHLGASATVLGIMAGMMPLLVIFQIPAAYYVNEVGYKRFVYAGWGVRVMFIFGMALVPLAGGFLNHTTQLALLLMLLFCFNLSRGISSAAWLPWITSLVPPGVRGRYLSMDAAVTNLASLVSFVISAVCLGGQPQPWRFALIFGFSGVMGAISLAFLKRIPDAQLPESVRASRHPVPWREMASFAPFRKLLRMLVVWSVAYGGMTTFTVAYLTVMGGLPDGTILLWSSVSFLGGLCSLGFLGSRLDALGSRPVLRFAYAVWVLIAAGWMLLAGEVVPLSMWPVLVLQFLMGLFAALVTMAALRLAMVVIPEMGRNHFFAMYTVLSSVALGLAPVGWGLMIDAVGSWQGRGAGIQWNRYSLFFAATALLLVGAWGLARRLVEPEAASMEKLLREILIQAPQRMWIRLWPRG